jgi:hypothetical protein
MDHSLSSEARRLELKILLTKYFEGELSSAEGQSKIIELSLCDGLRPYADRYCDFPHREPTPALVTNVRCNGKKRNFCTECIAAVFA